MDIDIEGHVVDANTGEPVKDIKVSLIHEREFPAKDLSDKEGHFALRVRKAKPGSYLILAEEAEGGFRYVDKEECLEIDALPHQTRWDILLSKR